jgi:putative membrane protein
MSFKVSRVRGRGFVAALALGSAAAAFAQQTGNPAVMSPDTPKNDIAQPPPDHPNTADQVFARQMMIGGQSEVDLGKLAGRKAQSSAVKEFAKRMVDDHTKANSRLESLAKANRAQIPGSPAVDPDVKAMRAQLEKLNGAEFDAAYIAAQVGDHQKAVHLLEYQIGAGQDAKMKQYAQETLPGVMRHLEMARQIQVDLANGQAK